MVMELSLGVMVVVSAVSEVFSCAEAVVWVRMRVLSAIVPRVVLRIKSLLFIVMYSVLYSGFSIA